jgi:hypothetical protein
MFVEDSAVCGGVVLQLYSTGWAARAFIRWRVFVLGLAKVSLINDAAFFHYCTNIYSRDNHLGLGTAQILI